MTSPSNHSFDPRDDGRDGGRDDGRSREHVFYPETMFVASLLHSLRERQSPSAKALASDLVELGPITGKDFYDVVSGMNHRETILEVLHSLHSLIGPGARHDVVEMVPTLIALTEKLVMGERDADEVSRDRLVDCFARVVGVLEDDRVVCRRAREEVGTQDLNALRRIAQKGLVDRDGYWTSLVLQCVLDPSPESLFYLDHAIGQLDVKTSPDDFTLISVRRAASAISGANFSDVIEWLAASEKTERNKWALSDGLLGMCEQAAAHHGVLMRYMIDGERDEKLVACSAALYLGLDSRFGLMTDARRELTAVLRAVASHGQATKPADFLTQTSTRALLANTSRAADVRRVHEFFLSRLEAGIVPTPELAHSYATAASRVHRAEPLKPVVAHTMKSTQASSEEILYGSIAENAFKSAKSSRDPEQEIARFVAALTTKSSSEIDPACKELAGIISFDSLSPRSDQSDDIFTSDKEALRFVRRYNYILEQSLVEVAALLLPELVAVVERSVLAPQGRIKAKLTIGAIEGLEQLAYQTAARPSLRDVAQRRLSAGDWELLESLPGRTREGDYNVPMELSTAALGLTLSVGTSDRWQDELLTLWRECPDEQRANTDPASLPFFSVVAERRFPGSPWSIISRASVWRDDRELFRGLTYGLLGNPDYPTKICELVTSDVGANVSKGFLLAQAMRDHFTDEEREQVLSVARSMVGEMGVLGLDAVVTVSALSRSLDDVGFLMKLEAPAGVDEKTHHVTCFDGVARILRNVRSREK